MEKKRIVCTVTNDLHFDQRMIRICSSLQAAGYEVTLVGRLRPSSGTLKNQTFQQKRLKCFFDKGKFFYVEYNIRLFFFLLFYPTDLICSIDLDTILPAYFASQFRKKKRVFDAHELFCEMDEIVSRPTIYRLWKKIERFAMPKFQFGYTIGEAYANEFNSMYGLNYEIVRNATVLRPLVTKEFSGEYILYQGAVNEGRCFEFLIPAMKSVNYPLLICGEGNFFEQAKALVKQHELEDRITFTGYIPPSSLSSITEKAIIGITLFSNVGRSNYLSMANRFFDYMHAGIPQLCMNYPEYKSCNERFELALLIDEPKVEVIAQALNSLLSDRNKLLQMRNNALMAREQYCWQNEEKKLIQFYQKIFAN